MYVLADSKIQGLVEVFPGAQNERKEIRNVQKKTTNFSTHVRGYLLIKVQITILDLTL
jgi:hypothetical protein